MGSCLLLIRITLATFFSLPPCYSLLQAVPAVQYVVIIFSFAFTVTIVCFAAHIVVFCPCFTEVQNHIVLCLQNKAFPS